MQKFFESVLLLIKIKKCFLLFISIAFLTSCSKLVIDTKLPDFCQENPNYVLPGRGKPYCGPTAASNILIYLDKTTSPNILDSNSSSDKDQFELIKLLGSEKYMNTMLDGGTEPVDLMRGLETYVKERGYEIKILWKGWQDGDKYFINSIPGIKWIQENIKDSSNVILQIGWYKYDKEKDYYKRIGGHYVTVAGINNCDEKEICSLIIHDSSVRSGIKPKDEICSLDYIGSGTLSKWEEYKERSAIGYHKLNGIKVREGSDFGIVDGVVVFKVSSRAIYKERALTSVK